MSFLLILILFTFVPKADAQTTETDTIFYYDRNPDDFCAWIDTCLFPGFCQPLAVGFDLSPGFSFSLKELRVSVFAQGTFPYSIHQGIEWPTDSNKIYQDTIVVQRSERDSTGDSLIVYKSIFLAEKQELRNLTEKFWVVFDTKTYIYGNTLTRPYNFSKHSFYKFITTASWDSMDCEWIVDAIVEKETIGIKPDSNPELISVYNLIQNYPNPFNSETMIRYALPKGGRTSIIVYDLVGKEITRRVDRFMSLGYHTITWNAGGSASGIYFYTITSSDFHRTMKMVIMK